MSIVTICPICQERYNNTRKIPKMLSCGHTICQECLISQKNILHDNRCPLCRQNQSLDNIDNLPTNRLVYDLLYNPQQEEQIFVKEKNKFKIILLGSAGTGKTSLLNRFVNNRFNPLYEVTIGFDFKVSTMKVGEEYIDLQYGIVPALKNFNLYI